MAPLKSKIQSAVKSGKINKFFLFLAIAFMILLLSKLSKDYTKTVTFAIKTINLPEEQVIIADSTHKMDVLLRTYGFKLMRYYLSDPKLSVNIENLQKINGNYMWTNANNIADIKTQFPSTVEVESIKPDTIIFPYDVNFVKKVPIRVLDNIHFAPGYNMLDNYLLEPDSVRLIGPKVIVDSIGLIETDTLTMSNVNTDINQTLNLNLPDEIEGVAMSSAIVDVKAAVDKFTEGRVEVPVTIVNLPTNVAINFFPKKVTVIFNTSLSNYDAISTGDFIVECDYGELNDEVTSLSPKIVKEPQTVRSARISQSKIEFIISQ